MENSDNSVPGDWKQRRNACEMRRTIGMICKYAKPKAVHKPFKNFGRPELKQEESWVGFNFHVGPTDREQKPPLNFIFLPILQLVYMHAPDQFCNQNTKKKRSNVEKYHFLRQNFLHFGKRKTREKGLCFEKQIPWGGTRIPSFIVFWKTKRSFKKWVSEESMKNTRWWSLKNKCFKNKSADRRNRVGSWGEEAGFYDEFGRWCSSLVAIRRR